MSRDNIKRYSKPYLERIALKSADFVTSSPIDLEQNEGDPYASAGESWRDVLDELEKK